MAESIKGYENDKSFQYMLIHGVIQEIDIKDLDFLEEIGRGTYGIVSKAKYKGHIYAAKTLNGSNGKHENELNQDFINEVKYLAKGQHKNVIQLIGITLDRKYLLTEYMKLGSLYDLLHTRDDLSYTVQHAVSWIKQAADAMKFMHNIDIHSKRIIHRDLKSLNLLMADDGKEIKICDFGTARYCAKKMTNSKGSPVWMAPEVFKGKDYNEKCDVYSFGVLVWEILARKLPFSEFDNQWELLFKKVMEGACLPKIKGIPYCLDKLMERCCKYDPSERPQFHEIYDFMLFFKQFFSEPKVGIFNKENDFVGFDQAVKEYTPPKQDQKYAAAAAAETISGSPIPYAISAMNNTEYYEESFSNPFQHPIGDDDLPRTTGWVERQNTIIEVQRPTPRLLNSTGEVLNNNHQQNQISEEIQKLIASGLISKEEAEHQSLALKRYEKNNGETEINGWVLTCPWNEANSMKDDHRHNKQGYLGISLSREDHIHQG